jgi:hypothetical protein
MAVVEVMTDAKAGDKIVVSAMRLRARLGAAVVANAKTEHEMLQDKTKANWSSNPK